MHRRAYLPAHEILAELEHVLSENKKIYYKTGEGEPSG
jgi:hypothetical protein